MSHCATQVVAVAGLADVDDPVAAAIRGVGAAAGVDGAVASAEGKAAGEPELGARGSGSIAVFIRIDDVVSAGRHRLGALGGAAGIAGGQPFAVQEQAL